MDSFHPKIRAPFPNRTPENTRKTSDPDTTYNCFGWAFDPSKKIVMSPVPGAFWPAGVRRELRVEFVIEAYATIGYECCDSPDLEPGFEKIALYGTYGYVEHAARQIPSGKWEAKLGPEEDVEHDELDALSGGSYGSILQIMRRPIFSSAPVPC